MSTKNKHLKLKLEKKKEKKKKKANLLDKNPLAHVQVHLSILVNKQIKLP